MQDSMIKQWDCLLSLHYVSKMVIIIIYYIIVVISWLHWHNYANWEITFAMLCDTSYIICISRSSGVDLNAFANAYT